MKRGNRLYKSHDFEDNPPEVKQSEVEEADASRRQRQPKNKMSKLLNVGIVLLLICILASLYESRPNYRWLRRYVVKRGGNNVDKGACLRRLNEIRAAHEAGPMEWDPYLEKDAVKWANHLATTQKTEHDSQKGTSDKKGENIFLSRSGQANCIEALNHWYRELKIYKAKGACASPPDNGVPGTEDFTHLVWQTSDKVAVAVVGNVVVARFFPPGNFEGDYEYDVKC